MNKKSLPFHRAPYQSKLVGSLEVAAEREKFPVNFERALVLELKSSSVNIWNSKAPLSIFGHNVKVWGRRGGNPEM